MSIHTYIDLTEKDQISQIMNYVKSIGVDVTTEDSSSVIDGITELIDTLDQTWKQVANYKDLEGIVNSIISLLFTVPVDSVGPMVQKLCLKLEAGSQVEGKADLSFKLLHILFHGYPIENTFLYEVYCSWVKVALVSTSFKHLPCDLKKISTWLQSWDREESCTHNLYRLLYDTQFAQGQFKKASEVMVALLECFDEQSAANAREDAIKCVQRSIMDEDTFEFDHLLTLAPIKALEGEQLHQLLTIFVSGNIQGYLEFHKQCAENFMEDNGLNHDSNTRKMRLLTLVDMVGTNRELCYDDIIQAVGVEEQDIEELVIDAVTTKLIRGRIDEVNRKVIVSQACQRSFGREEWLKLAASLSKCKQQMNMLVQQLNSIGG